MPDSRISVSDRVRALDRLNEVAWELNAISAWLAGAGAETESDQVDLAATRLLAACWLLERPIRAQPPAGRWQANGHRDR